MKNTILIGIFILVNGCTFSQMKTAEETLLAEIKKGKTPSVSYTVFNKDSVFYQYENGFADIANQVRVSNKTTFNNFSVTKTFTALAILQLAEKGLLDINLPVKKYLVSFPYSEDITIKNLLNHTAGIDDPIPLKWIHLTSEHQSFERNKFFKPILAERKIKNSPNSKFKYSNLGYVILGQLIEQVSGLSYEDYVTKNIIEKIDLKPNELGFLIPDTSNHAKGYHKKFSFSNMILGFMIDKSKFMGPAEDEWKPFMPYYVNGVSYGGLIGTRSAFVKYIQELLRPDSKLISNSYKKLLFTENQTLAGENTGMALSWYTGNLNNLQYFTHAGGGGGYYIEIRIYPEIEMGSVIVFNRTGFSDERFLDNVDHFFIPKKPQP